MDYLDPSRGFAAREKFVAEWLKSKYELLYFRGKPKITFWKSLQKLQQQLPPTTTDPIESVEQNWRGNVHIGPALVLQYLFAQRNAAAKKEQEQKALEKTFAAVQDKFTTLSTKEDTHRDGDGDGEESAVAEETQDRTDVDGEDEIAVPLGVDLTLVPWHNELLQALLSIDTSTPTDLSMNMSRPASGRIPWNTMKEALALVEDDVSGLVDALESIELGEKHA